MSERFMNYGDVVRATWATVGRDYTGRIAEQVIDCGGLLGRLNETIRAEETAAWLAGSPDVSVGTSYEMKGWGDAAS